VSKNQRVWIAAVPLAAALAVAGWAGFAPVSVPSRDQLFEIPKGTYARRMAGNKVEILPAKIRLTLGLNDVLMLRNLDDVPQVFGPTIMMPGQSFRLPFEKAAEYQFACTAHASGQMTIVVEPEPVTPWAKIHWRVREWWENRKG
jgi:hypothetical protein